MSVVAPLNQVQSVYHTLEVCVVRMLCVVVHREMDLGAFALLMRYIVMSTKQKEQSKMTVSSEAHHPLCKQRIGVILSHTLVS